MEVLEKDKPGRLDEHLDYLNAVITLVSYIVTNNPKQEYLDAISHKTFYFADDQEKEAYKDLLLKARKFLLLNERMPEWDTYRRDFNSLEQKLFDPLSYIKDQERRIESLTREITEGK